MISKVLWLYIKTSSVNFFSKAAMRLKKLID